MYFNLHSFLKGQPSCKWDTDDLLAKDLPVRDSIRSTDLPQDVRAVLVAGAAALDVVPRRDGRDGAAGPDVRHADAAPLEAGGRYQLALAPVRVAVRATYGEQLVGVGSFELELMPS